MDEVLLRLPPFLVDEIVEEILLRLPPDEPAWLARSSAVCKPWRRILALPRFRRRYREFHGAPPLLGCFQGAGPPANFVPTSALLPAQPDRPGWIVFDCRHGRALLVPKAGYVEPFEFIVLDPLTGHQSRVPASPVHDRLLFSASVLCAAQDCNHHSCQGGHFFVALVSTNLRRVTAGWLYSSETRVWSRLTCLEHPDFKCASHFAHPSVLVGGAVYFGIDAIIKCQLGTPLSFSMVETPIDGDGRLMTAEDGGLGFAAVVDIRNLTLWSMETGPEGAMGWAIIRVIDLEVLLPNGLSNPELEYGIPPRAIVSGAAEGTQVIFVTTDVGCYLVDLKSGRVTMVCREEIILPYMGFYIPAMKATSTD